MKLAPGWGKNETIIKLSSSCTSSVSKIFKFSTQNSQLMFQILIKNDQGLQFKSSDWKRPFEKIEAIFVA